VSSAEVRIEGKVAGNCGRGLLLFVGFDRDENSQRIQKMASKIVHLRVFPDGDGRMNLPLECVRDPFASNLLVISNFTVYGDASGQNRPSFMASAAFNDAERWYEEFLVQLSEFGAMASTGVFGANMEITAVHDGPVTLILDT